MKDDAPESALRLGSKARDIFAFQRTNFPRSGAQPEPEARRNSASKHNPSRPDAEMLEALRRLDGGSCIPSEALLDLTRKPS